MAGNYERMRDQVVGDNRENAPGLALLAVPLVAKRWLYHGNAGPLRPSKGDVGHKDEDDEREKTRLR